MEIISLENLILRKKYDLRTYLGDNPSEDGFDYLMDLITFPDLIISVTKKETFFSYSEIYHELYNSALSPVHLDSVSGPSFQTEHRKA